jgi:hypothetical protein
MTVQDDVVALGDDTLEVDPLTGILLRHPHEVLNESLFPIGYARVVLMYTPPAYCSIASAGRH